eukprot:CAMPEP_0116833194 /NCGR_PEP_ID=MMETSP0418-20121206/6305_1 /TAXON_ID=1158023 /ORGANISM="Astrosyne radiata, Strain 13vi08-1A" /LENGTH=449 /DNA_ID=CAMNT_0004462625 /DNA_START=1 /DNA_END=1347 /DNA_ORIENTATION=-
MLLCPKEKVQDVAVECCKYVVVAGNGDLLSSPPKHQVEIPKESIQMEVISKLRKGRSDDKVLTVGMAVVDRPSTCSQMVQACQSQLKEGVRGDATANPFNRRAPRRFCDAIAVSSLKVDDEAVAETEFLPEDIALLADRRANHVYSKGSFLGRAELYENPYTNAYREINGAGDGFPGWSVDRYGDWLLVQHDGRYPEGPLPSIHDGKTLGVYMLKTKQNRGSMGRKQQKPVLMEGKAAPEFFSVQENGIAHLVSLEKDLSTGLFLDQRPQRAWLMRNCNENTRVLNCFAHCGSFSLAAASAGASTVSLDLNKKWLDRIGPQLEMNEIDPKKHDTIYGDCFDWLARFNRRGETFDIVILDPPSSSVGIKKKRWSVKNDMDELVALAAPLVKKGGLLWTNTNSANMHPIKFARKCWKGLQNAGVEARLERIVPMPIDFPNIGPDPVKNFVW